MTTTDPRCGRRGSATRARSGRAGIVDAAPPATERGSATLAASGVVGLLVILGAALGVVAAMVHAHRVAQSAADLAALAGAHAATLGQDACGAAATIAVANGATLDTCAIGGATGADVRIHVTAPGPHWLGQTHDLSAEARAGPAGVPGLVDPEAPP